MQPQVQLQVQTADAHVPMMQEEIVQLPGTAEEIVQVPHFTHQGDQEVPMLQEEIIQVPIK